MERQKADLRIYSDEEIEEMGFILDEDDFEYPEETGRDEVLDPKNCLIDITVDSSEIVA